MFFIVQSPHPAVRASIYNLGQQEFWKAEAYISKEMNVKNNRFLAAVFWAIQRFL